jgi:hypothetical protein
MNRNQGLTDMELTTGLAQENEAALGMDAQGQKGRSLVTLKRVIWITGGKGGTGKSTFARGLLHILRAAGIEVAPFDGDPDNSQLYRHYKNTGKGVTRIAIRERGGADDVISEMEEVGTSVILIDVPAGGGNVLVGLEEEVGFLSALSEIGYGLTMVTLLSRVKDSVNQLKLALDITQDYDVAHVAVKNLYYGESSKFRFLDRSNTRQRLLDLGGYVIEMRDLYEDTYELVDEADLSFHDAISADSEVIPKPDVRRLKQWTNHFKQQVISTGGLLGL